ncbi:MAG: prepilin-type N-terminal cleavage/methylation domain-containing protein [Actinomycetota bacterium]
MTRKAGQDHGFTAIEVVVAISIFAIAAIAVLTVLLSGLRVVRLGRERTAATSLARERLEEMRRLPFYVSYDSLGRKADLLDYYFPDLGPGYDSVTHSYRTVAFVTTGAFANKLEIVTRFVNQSLETIPPPSNYQWNSATDSPPSRLIAVDVTVLNVSQKAIFAMKSVLGESGVAQLQAQGSASGTVIRIDTAFSDRSTLLVEAGKSTSSLHVGNVSAARSDVQAASAKITKEDGAVTEIVGATAGLSAPPDATVSSQTSIGAALVHPNQDLGSLVAATLGPSLLENMFARVTSSLPTAGGTVKLRHNGPDSEDGGVNGLTATNQVGSDDRVFDSTKPYVVAAKVNGQTRPAELVTSCTHSSTGVTCNATGKMAEVRLIPVSLLLPQSSDGYLIAISLTNISAAATAGDLAPASASTSFTGTVKYWRLDPADGWSQVTVAITNGGANALPDPATIPLGQSPINPSKTLLLSDYIASWSALAAGVTTVSPTNLPSSSADAVIDGIIRIATTPTNLTPLLENSGFLIRLGSLNVQAVDNR